MNVVKHVLTFLLTFCPAQRFTLGTRGWQYLLLADLENGRAVTASLTFQRFSTSFQGVPTIQNLLSGRRARANSLFVFQRAVSTDDVDVWMLLKPYGQCARRSVWQQVDRRSCFEIDDDRAIRVATPEREIIDTNDGRTTGGSSTADALTTHCIRASRAAPAWPPSTTETCWMVAIACPLRRNVSGQSNDKSFTGDLVTAQQLLTYETANGQLRGDGDPTGRQITQLTARAAVKIRARKRAANTSFSIPAGGQIPETIIKSDGEPVQGVRSRSSYDPCVTGLIVALVAVVITAASGPRTLIRGRVVQDSAVQDTLSPAG